MEIDRELVVGREDADLTIPDPEMSRRHAALRPVEEGVEIEDLQSLNGTRVDGRRITGPLVLSSARTVVVGKTELQIDVQLAVATRVSRTPDRSAQPADVTAARRSPVVPPVTTARPDVRERPAPVAAAVEDEQRPVPSAPLPASSAPAAPAASPVAPQGLAEAPRRTRPTTIALGVAGLVVATAVVLLALANTGDSKTSHALDATLRAGIVNRNQSALLLAGVESGGSTGDGAVTVDVAFRSGNALSLRSPSTFSARVVQRFDGGTLTSVVNGTATPATNGGVAYTGTGEFTDGTGDYEGASGRYRLRGTLDARGTGTFLQTGTIDY